jgi:aspartate-semialdehyde dehydrogenase
MNLALIGATGLVGQMMIKVMEERNLPCDDFFPAASERSVGKTIQFRNKDYKICSIREAVETRPDVAVFSAGAQASLEWAEAFASQGTFVIDNSSAWRMDPNAPLIVPEVNGHELSQEKKIIANPNCSTIQMVVALAPLHKHFNIKRLVISTYQSVTGTGVKAVKQLENERSGISAEMAYPYPIDLNCIPHGGAFIEDGYTTEEIKLVNETRKILGDESIQITATVVRIPVMGGHSEAINIEFYKSFDMQEVRKLLGNTPGLVLQDDPVNNVYPMPLYAQNKDAVFAGRLRRDTSVANGLNIWVVSDNLRKGAATNAIQIAELLREKKFIF